MKHSVPHPLVTLLEGSPILKPLGRAILEGIVARSSPRQLETGTLLWQGGECPDAVAIVLSGRLEIARRAPRGRKMRLRHLGPGEVVGLSTVAGCPQTADVVARGRTRVLIIPGAIVRSTVVKRPETALRVIAELGALVGTLTDDLEDLRYRRLDDRVMRRLRKLARGETFVEITHRELAEHVNATRENVSRALKRLERRGLVRCGRGRIELLDP